MKQITPDTPSQAVFYINTKNLKKGGKLKGKNLRAGRGSLEDVEVKPLNFTHI